MKNKMFVFFFVVIVVTVSCDLGESRVSDEMLDEYLFLYEETITYSKALEELGNLHDVIIEEGTEIASGFDLTNIPASGIIYDLTKVTTTDDYIVSFQRVQYMGNYNTYTYTQMSFENEQSSYGNYTGTICIWRTSNYESGNFEGCVVNLLIDLDFEDSDISNCICNITYRYDYSLNLIDVSGSALIDNTNFSLEDLHEIYL